MLHEVLMMKVSCTLVLCAAIALPGLAFATSSLPPESAGTLEAILDFIGERRYADHMIGCEIITHEGYDVPRTVFATFFGVVAETAKAELGGDWTPAMDDAWRGLLGELDAYVQATPLVGAAA